MSNQSKSRQHHKRHQQGQTLPPRVDLPPPPQNILQQQSPTGQQQQWLSTNIGGTPNFVPQNTAVQQPTVQQPQWTTSYAIQAPSPDALNVVAQHNYGQLTPPIYPSTSTFPPSMSATGQMGYGSYGADQQLSTMMTTTTTTTTQTSHQGGVYGQQHSEQPITQVTGQLQNLQIQQPYPEQQTQTPPPQLQMPVATPIQLPAMQNLPPTQQPPSVSVPPMVQQQQEPPAVQNQDPRYPVTFEQRQAAFSQWRSQNSTKPQRTLDRTMQEYMSGKKDKQIYETLINQQQS